MGTMSDLELVAGAESIPTKCLVAALSATWEMIDPLRPPGVEGSYARGRHNGIADALSQFRANLALELRRAPPQPGDA